MTDAPDPAAALTPDAIVDYPLERAMRGYSTKQVDGLLDRLADQVEQLLLERELADQRAESAETRIAEVEETEATLRRTLVSAQRTAEDLVAEAQTKAARLVVEAEERAEQILADVESAASERREAAEQHVERLERNSEVRVAAAEERVRRLRALAGDLRAAIREQLDRHRALLDDLADIHAERTSDEDPDIPTTVSDEDSDGPDDEADIFGRPLSGSPPDSDD